VSPDLFVLEFGDLVVEVIFDPVRQCCAEIVQLAGNVDTLDIQTEHHICCDFQLMTIKGRGHEWGWCTGVDRQGDTSGTFIDKGPHIDFTGLLAAGREGDIRRILVA